MVAFAGVDSEGEEDLLGIVIAFDRWLDLRFVESIGVEQSAHTVNGGLHVDFMERSSQGELARAFDLSPVGRFDDFPLHRDAAQEPGVGCDEAHDNPVAGGLGFYDDVRKKSSTEQPINGVSDVRGAQWVTRFEGLDASQIGRIERLTVGKLDFHDRLALIRGGLRSRVRGAEESQDARGAREPSKRMPHLGWTLVRYFGYADWQYEWHLSH
jgi:hypothetical protein